MLAGDMPDWQNPALPVDVNGDGFVAPNDLLFIASELMRDGSRLLTGDPRPVTTSDAAGEHVNRTIFLDVNGDHFLTSADAHLVAMAMDGGGTHQVMQLRFDITDDLGASIDSANVNDEVALKIFVQDIRPDSVPNRGVTAAFLNVLYDSEFVSVAGPKTFGDEYVALPDPSDISTPGEIVDLGNAVTDFGLGGPLGPGEFLLVSVPFTVDAAAVDAVDDDSITSSGVLDVNEDGPAMTVNVLANDTLGGRTLWQGEPATTPIITDSFLFDDPVNPVPTDNIIYGTDSLVIDGTGSLVITDFDTTGTLGLVTNNGDGTFDYDPNGQFESLGVGEMATDSFEYTVGDGQDLSDTATVTATIQGVNDPPVANDDSGLGFTTDEETAFDTANVLLTNDTDPEDDVLSIFSVDTTGTLGLVTNNGDGTFNYDPNGQFDGLGSGQMATDSFSYTNRDGNGGMDTAVVEITVTGVDGGGNTPPVAVDDEDTGFMTNEDMAFVTANVLDNDMDDDLDMLTVAALDTTGTLGLVTDNGDGTFDYDPNGRFESLGDLDSTTDSFEYTVSDGQGGMDTATVTITIDGVNDPPDAVDDADVGFTTDQNTPFVTASVLMNDTDAEQDTLMVTGVNTVDTLGTVTDNGDRTFDYDPNGQFDSLGPGESATDTFSYTISDGNGGMDTAVVEITVNGMNNPPMAMNDSGTGYETDEDNSFVTANVLSNDDDLDGGTLSVLSIDTSATLGTVTDNGDGTFDYDPDGQFESLGDGQSTTDNFDYTVSNGQGGTATATVMIAIDGVNDDPMAMLDTGMGFTTNQDTAFTTASVLDNDTDAEDDTLMVSAIDTTGTQGNVSDNGDGTFDYDPNGQFDSLGLGQSAIDSFMVTISDGNGGMSTGAVDIIVTGTVIADVLFRLETTDPLGTVVSELNIGSDFLLKVFVQDIRTEVDPANRGVFKVFVDVAYDQALVTAIDLFTHGDAYQEETSGNVLTLGLVDEAGGTQTGFGLAPPFNGPLGPDEFLLFSLPFTAISAGEFTFFSSLAGPVQDHEILLFDPPDEIPLEDEIIFGVTSLLIVPTEVVANPDGGDGFSTNEDTAFTTGNVLANDVDADDDPLFVASFDTSGTMGIVIDNGDGTFDYDPNGQFESLGTGETATDTFTYTATDGDPRHEDTSTVTITINGVNDDPDAVDDSGDGYTTDENTAFTTDNVLSNDSDSEDDTLFVASIDTAGTMGTVVDNGDGTFDYDPNGQFEFLGLDETASDSFSYAVSDGSSGSGSATVMVTINGVNDPPMTNDDSGVGFMTDPNTAFVTGNVVTNDTDVDGGPLFISHFDTTGTMGTVIDNTDGTFDYDPNGQFDFLGNGQTATDSFIYTLSDGNGGTDMATVTITIVSAPPSDLVLFRLDTTDLSGTPISEVVQFEPFLLYVFVEDIRSDNVPDRGVFQGFLDVMFDMSLVMATGPFTFGENYLEETSGSIAAGLIDEAGGTQTGFGLDPDVVGPLGPGEFLLFRVRLEASAPGTVLFESDRADLAIFHDVTLFAPPVTVDPDDITYGTTSLLVTPASVVANPDGGAGFTTDEDTAFTTGNVLDNDVYADDDPLFVSAFDTTGTAGIVVNNADGTFNYDPNGQFDFLKPGETATDSFTYTATDGQPGHQHTATVTITITGVNDPPDAVNDSGVGFTTDENTLFTTASILDNDMDVEGDQLFIINCDTSGAIGQVSCNPDGTVDYDPDGQFDFLLVGESTTDSFTYSISDGTDLAMATVMITIEGAPPPGPGTVNGFVYADVDHDGEKDAVERTIGDVEIRLEGIDVFGETVTRSAFTDSLGGFGFIDVVAGIYDLFEVQPDFFVDGIDTVNGVVHTGLNDHIAIDTSNIDGPEFDVLFGERSLHPDFISVADIINTALREGIVVGFDADGNQLWHSLMDGWDGVTSVSASFSADGATGHLSVTLAAGGELTYMVPTDPTALLFRVKGETEAGRVVQFIGTMTDLDPLLSDSIVDAAFAGLDE